MNTSELAPTMATLFSELATGADTHGGAYVLNSGDIGLLASLDKLSSDAASKGANGGATIAAHAQHVRYGLSLMNKWAREGGNPFADAKWDLAWKTTAVQNDVWSEIRAGLREECRQWLEALKAPRDASLVELNGMIGSIAHLSYHLGAIRQIDKNARGPKEGTFV
jgi:hypothetical protein